MKKVVLSILVSFTGLCTATSQPWMNTTKSIQLTTDQYTKIDSIGKKIMYLSVDERLVVQSIRRNRNASNNKLSALPDSSRNKIIAIQQQVQKLNSQEKRYLFYTYGGKYRGIKEN